jgi:hypothetical protein
MPFVKIKKELGVGDFELIENWVYNEKAYEQDTFVYGVRGKEIK